MMRTTALLALWALCLAGCMTAPAPSYGNLAPDLPGAFEHTLTEDVVKQLMAIYPPASTQWNLQHPATDSLSASLISMLRREGYGLWELSPGAGSPSSGDSAPPAGATPAVGQPLRYVIEPIEPYLYRITLWVGQQSLTRAYLVADNGALYPAGAWARKE